MFTFFSFGLLTTILSCLINGVCGKQEIIFDAGVGENRKIVNLNENSSNVIIIHNIPPSISVVLFEVHSHVHNITLSQTEEIWLHYSVTGRNIGMVYSLHKWESEARMWLMNKVQKNFSVLVIISVLDSYGPTPGGCNMEFSTEIAPYLRLRNNIGKTYVEYQHANIGIFRDEPAPLCSISLSYISYDIYVLYFKENDFSEAEYFSKIITMSNASLIKKSSKKVLSYLVHPDTRLSFLMYPNIGVVYNIIAKYTVNGVVKEALYVPVSSYGCGNAEFTEHGCNFSYSFEGKAFLFILSMYGFITAYFGNLFHGSKILKICGICGIIGGGVWLLLWKWLQNSAVSLLPVGFVLGFLLAATVLYSPIGNYEINLNDKNYWLLLATGSLFVTVILIAYPTVLSILGSSVVGSYVMLLFYDDFIGTRLSYIILNVVKRAVSENLEFAANNFPFQIKDALICIVWAVLTIFAIVIQSRAIKQSPDGINLCFYKSRRPNSNAAYNPEANPHQPLCSNNDTLFYNTFPKQ